MMTLAQGDQNPRLESGELIRSRTIIHYLWLSVAMIVSR